jgi:hypothetical protein
LDGNSIVVGSTNDLKPANLILLRRIYLQSPVWKPTGYLCYLALNTRALYMYDDA